MRLRSLVLTPWLRNRDDYCVLGEVVEIGGHIRERPSQGRVGVALRMLVGIAACLPMLALSAPALAQEGDGQGAPAVSAIVGECITASTAADRSVTFTGQMETVTGAHRMAMQIVVQEHAPGDVGFHTLTAAGVGDWQRSEVGVKIYKYVRQVTDLPAPAVFRGIVEYRWLNEKGRVIRSDERRTPICRQPDPRSKPPAAPAPSGAPGTPATPAAGTAPASATSSAATMQRA
jgi:hypothetical protein